VASLTTGHTSIIVLALLFGGSKGNPAGTPHGQLDGKHKKPLQTFRPFNIAHRGSNGELPEETAAAYLVTKSFFFSHMLLSLVAYARSNVTFESAQAKLKRHDQCSNMCCYILF
jgi:hypothetical protein